MLPARAGVHGTRVDRRRRPRLHGEQSRGAREDEGRRLVHPGRFRELRLQPLARVPRRAGGRVQGPRHVTPANVANTFTYTLNLTRCLKGSASDLPAARPRRSDSRRSPRSRAAAARGSTTRRRWCSSSGSSCGGPERDSADACQLSVRRSAANAPNACLLMRPGRLELPRTIRSTRPSTLRVYQFRHRRVVAADYRPGPGAGGDVG